MPASAPRRHIVRACGALRHHLPLFTRTDAMPNITLLDLDALKKTKLRPYIEKCLEHRAPDPGFHAIMGHNIDLCEAMFVAWDTLFNTGRVSHTLKEIIRVQLSRMASCVY
jgi:hypothetical protein